MRRLNARGFTVTELIVVLAVVGLISAVMMTFLADRFVDQLRLDAQAQIQQQARQTLSVIGGDVKHSAGVDEVNRWEDVYGPGGASDPYGWSSDETVLILARPAQDTTGNILFKDGLGYVSHKDNLIFFTDNGSLFRRTLAADADGNRATSTCPAQTPDCRQDVRLADNVTSLVIEYLDGDGVAASPDSARAVKLTIELERSIYGQAMHGTYELMAVFRNE